MSEAQNMSVKAYLTHPDQTQEVRRFGIPESASTSYNYLQERIRNIFSLGTESFKLQWKDLEGDLISISSDEELFSAIAECTTNQGQQGLRIYVKVSESENNQEKYHAGEIPWPHFGITCDNCNGPVFGIRYKCKTCPNFDLCQNCKAKDVHKHHEFFVMDKPSGFGLTMNAHVAEELPEDFAWRHGCHRFGRGRGRGWRRFPHHQFHGDGHHARHHARSSWEPNPAHFTFHTSPAGVFPFMAAEAFMDF